MNPFAIGNLKIPIPIVLGGMGIGIFLSGLVSAVANMGEVRVISIVSDIFAELMNGYRNAKNENNSLIQCAN